MQMRTFPHKGTAFSAELSYETVEGFSWDVAIDDARQHAPSLVQCLEMALPKERKMASQRIKGAKGQKR